MNEEKEIQDAQELIDEPNNEYLDLGEEFPGEINFPELNFNLDF